MALDYQGKLYRALNPLYAREPIDHVAFGRKRPNAKNVIDSNSLEHCSSEKPVPTFSRNALAGRGSELYGGRFNPKGVPALYTSLSIMTALREANQVGSLQPTTLVSYEAAIEQIFDTHDTIAMAAEGIDADLLAAPSWRDEAKATGKSRTQAFAQRLMAKGYRGLLVRSFAAGAGASDLNLVLWAWADAPPAQLILIDDEGRLSR